MTRHAKPRGLAVLLGVAVVAISAGPGAFAQPRLDSTFVELLARSGKRRHPLADAAGRLPVVATLPLGMQARDLGFAPFAAGLGALRLAPSELSAFEAKHPGVGFSIWPPFHPVLDQSQALNGTFAYRDALLASGSSVAGTGRGVVVGIIDTGIDVTHPDFRDSTGHTRIAWLLDLAHPPIQKHPELEAEFGCTDPTQTPCAVLDRTDIDLALQGDSTLYLPRDTFGHGTHVASIAAGNGGGTGSRFLGGAPEATLVIAGVSQGTGAVTDIDIAAGARFVFERAEQLGAPAVANLSLGGDFGPHDGSSPVEKALAELVGPDHPGRALVVAAGNSGSLYRGAKPEQTFGIHSQLRVTSGVPARMPLVSAGHAGDAELSGAVYIWITYGAKDEISISLEGPGGISLEGVPKGAEAGDGTPESKLRGAIYNGVVGPNSLLTSDTHGAIVIWEGSWAAGSEAALRFEGEGFVDAWVETATASGSQDSDVFFEVATRQGTINVPATHPDLISVGCTVNRTQWTDQEGHLHDSTASSALDELSPVDGACYFSSAGPTATGVMKPEISAPGAMVAAAMSRDAIPGMGQPSIFDAPPSACPDKNECLVVDAGHALLSGSSMSAPQVAGAIALLLERDRTLTQPEILQLLEQGARLPAGTVPLDYQLGVGALDTVGTMAAYEARASGLVREPDAGRSWMSLSDAYAHPDETRLLTGVIEVRAQDGSLADGFDPHRLTLEVQAGGFIKRPLTRVGPGLWNFAVGALSDSGGNIMQIDARLDGVPIGRAGTRLAGHRGLPIGGDRWTALGTARAFGGCAVGAFGGHTRWGVLGGLALAAASLQRRRRDRRGLRWSRRAP